mgnify:FL=1
MNKSDQQRDEKLGEQRMACAYELANRRDFEAQFDVGQSYYRSLSPRALIVVKYSILGAVLLLSSTL